MWEAPLLASPPAHCKCIAPSSTGSRGPNALEVFVDAKGCAAASKRRGRREGKQGKGEGDGGGSAHGGSAGARARVLKQSFSCLYVRTVPGFCVFVARKVADRPERVQNLFIMPRGARVDRGPARHTRAGGRGGRGAAKRQRNQQPHKKTGRALRDAFARAHPGFARTTQNRLGKKRDASRETGAAHVVFRGRRAAKKVR